MSGDPRCQCRGVGCTSCYGWPYSMIHSGMTAPQSGTDPTSELPGGPVPGIGWVALASDVPDGTMVANTPSGLANDSVAAGRWSRGLRVPMVVTRWADGTVPSSADALAAAGTAPTPPAVDVTALDEWAELVSLASAEWLWPSEENRQITDAARELIAAVRAQGVPSTDPSGGA